MECYSDDDCGYTEVCYQGSCADACQITKCGANARCEASFHSARCSCPDGYTGNPQIACTRCKYHPIARNVNTFCLMLTNEKFFLVGLPVPPEVPVGCASDDDCPEYTACRNRKCINPCALDKPCAPSAICKVVNHNPVCTCPNGFIGSPYTRCSPRKLAPSNCTYYCGTQICE